ncbi:hypothetical protein CBER1_05694 [Cercospora berteroae]|uniref:Uncharacterized protein n=1 Tax=Cercospora berteroae TaxID=357750 RepID=A0A2S6C668_9PEZI|nr:hypothetical protein CBER1_05694 [Cercospora berteroae]
MAAATSAAGSADASQVNGSPPPNQKFIFNTRPFLFSALNILERQAADRFKAHAALDDPSASTAAGRSQKRVCTSGNADENAGSIKKLTKSQRRLRLQRLRGTTDVEEARRLASDIVTEWHGCGLHVFEAMRLLAAFPTETVSAIEMLFTALEKLARSWAGKHDVQKIWRQLRREEGLASRYIKSADKTLTQLVCRHWLPKLKADDVDTFDWSSLLLRSLQTFGMFTSFMATPTSSNKAVFAGSKQILLPSAGVTLLGAHAQQCNRLIVHKIAIARLPPELIDMIVDYLDQRSLKLHVATVCGGSGGHQIRCRPFIVKAVAVEQST